MGMAVAAESVRAALKECAWGVLKQVAEPPARPVTVRARTRVAVAVVTLAAADAAGHAAGEPLPGQHFSPLGAAIWGALADGPLPGKKIATRCGLKYTPGFAVILKEYVDRGVLDYNRRSGGYFRKVTVSHNDRSH